LASIRILWIRIRKKWIRIRNPVQGGKPMRIRILVKNIYMKKYYVGKGSKNIPM
jgi:hypothetical protein